MFANASYYSSQLEGQSQITRSMQSKAKNRDFGIKEQGVCFFTYNPRMGWERQKICISHFSYRNFYDCPSALGWPACSRQRGKQTTYSIHKSTPLETGSRVA